jgi:hypothetical protein
MSPTRVCEETVMASNDPHHSLRPGDLAEDLTISLEEAAAGKTETLRVRQTQVCEACAGTGESWRRDDGTCPACGNSGRIEHYKVLRVSIPAGVESDRRLRLAGEGEDDPAGAARGDLYVSIHVRRHERFERRGKELRASVRVPPDELSRGTDIIIPTLLDGRKQLHVPPGTAYGTVLRLAGLGLRSIESSERGDLLIKVKPPTDWHDSQAQSQHAAAPPPTSPPPPPTATPPPASPKATGRILGRDAKILAVITLAVLAAGVVISLNMGGGTQNQNTNAGQYQYANFSRGRNENARRDENTSVRPSPDAVTPPIIVAPPATPRAPFSLPNGTDITPPQGPRGDSSLTIINDGYYDVAVKVVHSRTRKTRRFVYVRANSRAVIRNVAREVCTLLIMSGTDWDESARRFRYDQGKYKFDKDFDFSRARHTVGLSPSPEGTLRPIPVSEEEFEDK